MKPINVRFDESADPIVYRDIPGTWQKVFVRGGSKDNPVFWEVTAFVAHAFIEDLNRCEGHIDFKMDLSESLKTAFRKSPDVSHEVHP